ncbi:MAG: histidine kinase, partial [Chitinophagaceae bacterium]
MHNNNNTPLHPDENRRLSELKEYQIIDTSEEEDFESLTRLASKICDTPIALITLLDETRQWFKSKQGLEVPETPREHAFCSYAIVEPTGVLEVEDARADLRFHENPLVNSDPNIVFYAGISLLTPTGMPLGTLCVIDRVPRTLSAGQLDSLSILAKQVMAQMELRKKVRMLDESNRQLTESNEFMQRFATTAAHDLKNPLSGIHMSAELMMRFLKGSEDQRLLSLASTNLTSAKKLVKMVNDMLEYSLRPEILSSSRSEINFYDFLDRTIAMI